MEVAVVTIIINIMVTAMVDTQMNAVTLVLTVVAMVVGVSETQNVVSITQKHDLVTAGEEIVTTTMQDTEVVTEEMMDMEWATPTDTVTIMDTEWATPTGTVIDLEWVTQIMEQATAVGTIMFTDLEATPTVMKETGTAVIEGITTN